MQKIPLMFSFFLVLVGLIFIVPGVFAQTSPNPKVADLLKSYLLKARQKNPGLKAFSPDKGKAFYLAKRTHSEKNESRACSTCHTTSPQKKGRTKAGKVVLPLAPSANPKRLTRVKKIKKWFKRNCSWVLERPCTHTEKGHFLAYLFSL